MIPEGKSSLILRGFQGLKMPDPLRQRWVGIIKPGIEGVGVEVSQVVFRQALQSAAKCRVEPVSL